MFTTLYGPSVVRNLESELFSTEKLRCHSKCPDSALSTSIANHTSNNHGPWSNNNRVCGRSHLGMKSFVHRPWKQSATRENQETVRIFVSYYYGKVLEVIFDLENQTRLFTSGEKWWNQFGFKNFDHFFTGSTTLRNGQKLRAARYLEAQSMQHSLCCIGNP